MFRSQPARTVCLGGIGLGLIGLHVLLSWQIIGQTDNLILTVLLWTSLLVLVHRRWSSLDLGSDWFSTGLGTLLIALICFKSLSLFSYESLFVKLLPGFIAIGFGLIAVGFRVLRYWREGLLVAALMLPQGAISLGVEKLASEPIRLLIAKSTTFLLHYLGFSVVRQGVDIQLPFGAVSVEYQCVGVSILILLWQLSIPFFLLFSLSVYQKMGVAIATLIITFSLSCIRITIMALAVANDQRFDYWHGSAGGQLFSTLGIMLFGGLCLWIIEMNEAKLALQKKPASENLESCP